MEKNKQVFYKPREKLYAVMQYIKTGKYIKLENRTQDSASRTIRNWVDIYKRNGFAGLKGKKKKTYFSYKEKLIAIGRVRKGRSYKNIALSLGAGSSETIRRWHRIWLQYGNKGLKYEQNYRHILNKKKLIKIDKKSIMKYTRNPFELEKLLIEFKKCRTENIYLKKIYALTHKR